jgi:aromatic-L-amino-acid decarboxylase
MDPALDRIVRHLEENERKGRALDLASEQREAGLREVVAYADRFLDGLPMRKAYEAEGYGPTVEDEGFTPEEAGTHLPGLLDILEQRVDRTGLNPASGGHLGYIPGGGLPVSAWGDLLAAVTNRYAGNFYASPGAVRMENAMVGWSAGLLGWTEGFGGSLTSGGSMANLTALAAARSAKEVKGKDLERTVVYLSPQAHHSLPKALRITGLGECILRWVQVDDHWRMDPQALREQLATDRRAGLHPFLLIANAGSTDTGAVDPLGTLAAVAAEHELWFHVDAAYGGYFLLTPHGREVMAGIEQADSVVMDPHKGLFLPYGTGIVLVKDVRHLLQAHGYEANYMQDARGQAQELSPAELSPELSKHFRGLRMWLPLKLHGVACFRACLEEKLGLARYFRHQVRSLGYETGPEPDLSVVCFRLTPRGEDPEAVNRAIAHAVQKDGRVFISTTLLDGRFTLRFAALSFRTHRREVDILLELLARLSAPSTG